MNSLNIRVASCAIMIIAGLMAMVGPAAARRGFAIIPIPGFGGGSSESITLVHDLPDQEPYVREGKFFDVGYLNSASRAGFVIYSGDRFTKISDEQIADLTVILGFDPTAQYRADHHDEWAAAAKEAEADRVHKQNRIASGRLIEREVGESDEAYNQRKAAFLAEHRVSNGAQTASTPSDQPEGGTQTSKTGMGGMLALSVLAVVAWINRRSFFGGFKENDARSSTENELTSQSAALDTGSFDDRVAHRLAQLNGQIPEAHQAPPSPPVRGFGRKAV